jgi:hypothetical protein
MTVTDSRDIFAGGAAAPAAAWAGPAAAGSPGDFEETSVDIRVPSGSFEVGTASVVATQQVPTSGAPR